MPKLTNGTITLSRKVRDGEYAGRDATVSLSFNTEDAEGSIPEDYIDYVRVLVVNKAQTMLGLPVVASQLATNKAPAEAADLLGTSPAAVTIGGKVPTTRKKKEAPAETPAADLTSLDAPAAKPAEVAGPKPITDAELVSAINRKVEETADTPSIRALIDAYDKEHKPGVSRNIPVDARKNFLVELAALKKSDIEL